MSDSPHWLLRLREKRCVAAYLWRSAALLWLVVVCTAQAAPTATSGDKLRFLHWWSSASEHAAISVLSRKLEEEDVHLEESLVPNGSGVGAIIVLKSSVLAGDIPEVAQINGPVIGDWADVGLLVELDDVANLGKWDKQLQPMLSRWLRPRGHVVAVPLGIHRVNTLFINKRLFDQYQLSPPQTWEEAEHVARRLSKAGITPLAQGTEPWQVATLFENFVLADGGVELFRAAFVRKDPAAYLDARFATALKRLRTWKQWMQLPGHEQSWTDVTRSFAEGHAAMMLMGDWAKGELTMWGYDLGEQFLCVPAPSTASWHLFDIDTLAMFATYAWHRPAQERLAQVALSPYVQSEYNRIKGSIPVLRTPDLSSMDDWSKQSWQLFSRGAASQVPSFAHRMATDETSREALIKEIHKYFMDDKASVLETQKRLAAIAKVVSRMN